MQSLLVVWAVVVGLCLGVLGSWVWSRWRGGLRVDVDVRMPPPEGNDPSGVPWEPQLRFRVENVSSRAMDLGVWGKRNRSGSVMTWSLGVEVIQPGEVLVSFRPLSLLDNVEDFFVRSQHGRVWSLGRQKMRRLRLKAETAKVLDRLVAKRGATHEDVLETAGELAEVIKRHTGKT